MSTRIKGRKLLLTLDGEDYYADCTQVWLRREDAEANIVTFEDAGMPGGAQQEYFEITAIQSTDPDSFWSYLWDHTGEEVPFVYAPHGNPDPTPSQPHFTGIVHIGVKPEIGGEAGRNNEYTFETRWDVEGHAVKETGI